MSILLFGVLGVVLSFVLFTIGIRKRDPLVFVGSAIGVFLSFVIFFKGIYILYVPLFS